jgi:hypothetical protein
MSVATAVVSVVDQRSTWHDGSKYFVLGNIAVGASPLTYVTGGIAMSFFIPLIKASRTPIIVLITGQSGYVYQYVPGTDASLGLLKIFQQSAATSALTEIPASAVPAGVSGDTINFMAIFYGME